MLVVKWVQLRRLLRKLLRLKDDAVKLEKELAKDGKYLYLFIVVNLIS